MSSLAWINPWRKDKFAKSAPRVVPTRDQRLGKIALGQVGSSVLASQVTISSSAELKILPSRITKFRVDIVGNISSRICPAILENGDWIILVTQQAIQTDSLSAAIQRCKQASGRVPQVYKITPNYLLTLRQGGSKDRTTQQSEHTVHQAAFDEILNWAIRNKASDVHLNLDKSESYSQICFTIGGQYVSPISWRIPTEQLESLINVAWQNAKGGASPVFSADSEQQARIEFTVDNAHYMGRWAGMAVDRGHSVCIRLLSTSESVVTRSLEDQGFLPSQVAMFLRAQLSEGGVICLAGVVGSGKSTTIATLLSMLPNTRKIITLEDPVEYRIPNALQNTIARSLDENEETSFLAKLRTVKRSAPHDLLIGEIRDVVTGLAFMDVTGTGTNVYTTVHAKSAFQIPERLASSSIGVPTSFLASPGILNLLVFQALIPVLCPHCSLPIGHLKEHGGEDIRGVHKEPEFWSNYIDLIGDVYNVDASSLRIKNPNGCDQCRHPDIPELSGYSGRTVVAEMIEPNADREVLRCVRSGDTLSLQEHLEKAPRTSIDDPDMTNKTIMECAMFKALQGLFDPRDIEVRTHSFETEQLIRRQRDEKATS